MNSLYNPRNTQLLKKYQEYHGQLISSLTKIQYEITSYYSKIQKIQNKQQWPRSFIEMRIYSQQQSQKLFSIIKTFSNQIKQTQFINNRFLQSNLQKYKQTLYQNLKSLQSQTVHFFTHFVQCKQKRISVRDDKRLQLTYIYLDSLIKMIKQVKQVIDKILKLQIQNQSNNNLNNPNNNKNLNNNNSTIIIQLQQKVKSKQIKCQNLQKVNSMLQKKYLQIQEKYQRKLINIENQLNMMKYNQNNLIYQNRQLQRQNLQLKECIREMENKIRQSKRIIQIESEDLEKNELLIRIKRKKIKNE